MNLASLSHEVIAHFRQFALDSRSVPTLVEPMNFEPASVPDLLSDGRGSRSRLQPSLKQPLLISIRFEQLVLTT
jgi:hypothetical protein